MALLAVFLTPMARGAAYYWDDNGLTNGFGAAAGTWAAPTTGNASQGWSTSSGGTVPPVNVTTTTGDDLNFGFSTNGLATGAIAVSGTVQANSLTIATNSGDITLSGGTIFIGGASAFIRANNSGQIITSALTLNTNLSVIAGINGNPVLSLNGAMGGSGNVTFTTPAAVNGSSGQNTVINLGAANTYTGSTRITTADNDNSLTIEAQVANALPRTTVLRLDGGVGAGSGRTVAYELNGRSQTLAGLSSVAGLTARNQRILNSTGSATLTISNTASFTFSGNINGTGLSLPETGSGTQTLARTNGDTGATTINAGRLQGVVGGNCSASTVVLNSVAATYGVVITNNSQAWRCAALTANAAGTREFDFDGVAPGASTSPLNITGLANFTAANPTVSVLVPSAIAAGTYPLMTWGSVSGTAPTAVTVSPLSIGTGAGLSVAGNTLFLVISNLPPVNMTVRVETKADGTGVVVPAATIPDGATRTHFAIARDSGGAFLGNVPANWWLTNLTGGVVPLDLRASPDGLSAIFTGNAAGSARVAVFANGTNHVLSGLLTVTNTFTTRPFIWVRSWERNGILAKIATNAWATSVQNGMVNRVAADLLDHQTNRDTWLRVYLGEKIAGPLGERVNLFLAENVRAKTSSLNRLLAPLELAIGTEFPKSPFITPVESPPVEREILTVEAVLQPGAQRGGIVTGIEEGNESLEIVPERGLLVPQFLRSPCRLAHEFDDRGFPRTATSDDGIERRAENEVESGSVTTLASHDSSVLHVQSPNVKRALALRQVNRATKGRTASSPSRSASRRPARFALSIFTQVDLCPTPAMARASEPNTRANCLPAMDASSASTLEMSDFGTISTAMSSSCSRIFFRMA